MWPEIITGVVGVVVGIVGALVGVIYSQINRQMRTHELLDDKRFEELERASEKRHGENLEEFRRLNRTQGRLMGALTLALSSSASPEERRDMARILHEEA